MRKLEKKRGRRGGENDTVGKTEGKVGQRRKQGGKETKRVK